jgi:hypothetical protein
MSIKTRLERLEDEQQPTKHVFVWLPPGTSVDGAKRLLARPKAEAQRSGQAIKVIGVNWLASKE